MTSDPTLLAQEVLSACLACRPTPAADYDSLLALCQATATAEAASRALFGILVEGLADRFEPVLNDRYAALMAHAIGTVLPALAEADLLRRYEQIRIPTAFRGREPNVIYVLSRVTLGADIAVTSVILNGLKQRFPHARILFVGPLKNYALFAADPRIGHLALPYRRTGTLADRLASGLALRALMPEPDALVVDPDSRLTQTGLLPVLPPERTCFFESRGAGGDGDEALGPLTAKWVERLFGVSAKGYLAPHDEALPVPTGQPTAISLGVGENPAKRLDAAFEAGLLALLRNSTAPIVIDDGGGGEEAARVRAAIAASGCECQVWSGDFATFAAQIAASRLFIGYDSAGGHVAAVAGVPAISILRGAVSTRFAARWKPAGAQVIDGEQETTAVLTAVSRALAALQNTAAT